MLPSVSSACIIALLSLHLPSPVLADKKGNLIRILKSSKDGNMIKGKFNINIPAKINIIAKKSPKDMKRKKTRTKEKKGKKKTINPISNHKPKPNPVSDPVIASNPIVEATPNPFTTTQKPSTTITTNPTKITLNPIAAPTPNPSTITQKPSATTTTNPTKKDISNEENGTRFPRETIKLDYFETILQTDARKIYVELEGEHEPDESWETDIKKAIEQSKSEINGVGALLICNKTPLNYTEKHFEGSNEKFDWEKMLTDSEDEDNGVEAFKLSSDTPLNSGLKRFQEIKKQFFPDAEVDYANMFTLINSEEESCWSVRTNTDILQKLKSLKPPLYGIPFTGPMKLALGTVDGALGRDRNKNMKSRRRLASPELETSKFLISFWRDLVDQSLSTLDHIFKEFIDDFKKTKDTDTRDRHKSFCEECIIAYDDIKYNSNEKSLTVTIERLTPTPKCYLCFIDYISRKRLVASISPIIDMAPARYDAAPARYDANLFVQRGTDEKMPFFQTGLTGDGQVIQVSDTGLDLNHAFFFDSNPTVQISLEGSVNREGQVIPQHRKVVQYVSLTSDDVFDKDGHGTHISGSLAGMLQGNQLLEQPGIAPKSKIAVFKIFDSKEKFLLKDFEEMLALGRKADAYIHNASWTSTCKKDGPCNLNKYSKWTERIDRELFKNQMQLFLTVSGNFGYRENMSLGSIGVSKNAITVGALTNNIEGYDCIAELSSRGPTSDGRIKPDLVAPGTGIFSALSQEVDTTVNQEGESSTQIVSKQGTSMSTAIMSGTAALVRQYFIERYYRNENIIPSAALIKAALINGAQDVIWNDIGGIINTKTHAYDSQQGFGSVNLVKSLPLKNNFRFFVMDQVNILESEQHRYQIRKFNKNNCDLEDFSATITWMDEEGQGLINDIDLFAVMKSYNGTLNILYPNGQSKKRDKRNNVERIRVPMESNDEVTLYVRGTNINFTNRVKYAIVASGCW